MVQQLRWNNDKNVPTKEDYPEIKVHGSWRRSVKDKEEYKASERDEIALKTWVRDQQWVCQQPEHIESVCGVVH